MTETRLLVGSADVEHVEVTCIRCRAVWGFSRTAPPQTGSSETVGQQAETRCVWCNKNLPESTKSALRDLRRVLTSLNDTADFTFRLGVNETGRK